MLFHALRSFARGARDDMFRAAVEPANDQIMKFRAVFVNSRQGGVPIDGCKRIRDVEANDSCAWVNGGMGCQ